MNWAIKIISKTLMTKISHISWGGYDKDFYGIRLENAHSKVKMATSISLQMRNKN